MDRFPGCYLQGNVPGLVSCPFVRSSVIWFAWVGDRAGLREGAPDFRAADSGWDSLADQPLVQTAKLLGQGGRWG